MVTTVVCWNINKQTAPWRDLVGMGADIALLQEAGDVPEDVADRRDVGPGCKIDPGPDELAVRFHHRLVTIHPFPDGNGRHSRISADYLAQALGRPPFTWGDRLHLETDALRRTYLTALRTADRGDISPLLSFARS